MKWILQAVLLMTMISSGCKQQHKEEKTVRLNFLTEANSLDPRYGYEIPANHAVKMLFEGLMRNTPTGDLIPAAAKSYTLSEDQKMYTFKLRSANWSNGEPVTAYDFEYAWKTVIDPSIPTQGTADFYPIKNVQAVVKGEKTLESVGIRALDSETLEVELEYPTPYFLELTASSAYSPVNRHVAEEGGDVYTTSNGPFRIREWRPFDQLILEKNTSYWNEESVALDRVEVSIVEDVATQLALFEKGKSDWFGKPFTKLPLDAVPTLREKNLLHIFPERAVYLYFLNTQQFPFHNQKIRRAFSLAIDRQALVDHVLKEDEKVATSMNQEWNFFVDNDREEALHLFEGGLAELGLSKAELPPIKLSYCGIETNHRIALVVQQQWKDVFEIPIILDPQEWTTYYDNLSNGKLQIGGLSWHARIKDPIYNLQLFKYRDDRLNMSFWEDAKFQSLVDSAQIQTDCSERLALLKQAEERLMEEMPIIPIYFLSVSYAKNQALDDVYISDTNEIDFAWAHIEQ